MEGRYRRLRAVKGVGGRTQVLKGRQEGEHRRRRADKGVGGRTLTKEGDTGVTGWTWIGGQTQG